MIIDAKLKPTEFSFYLGHAEGMYPRIPQIFLPFLRQNSTNYGKEPFYSDKRFQIIFFSILLSPVFAIKKAATNESFEHFLLFRNQKSNQVKFPLFCFKFLFRAKKNPEKELLEKKWQVFLGGLSSLVRWDITLHNVLTWSETGKKKEELALLLYVTRNPDTQW